MKKRQSTKKFDAVKTMREIRDGLSDKYVRDSEAEDRDLQRIRKSYKIYSKETVST